MNFQRLIWFGFALGVAGASLVAAAVTIMITSQHGGC